MSNADSFMDGWCAAIESTRLKWVDMTVLYPPASRMYLTFHPLLGFSLLNWTDDLLWKTCTGNEFDGVTHWMELPGAPNE